MPDSNKGSKTQITKDPQEEGKRQSTDKELTTVPSETSTTVGENKGCCYRFWNAIFKWFANDAIYGSFVGPHPVSFLFFCHPCCCKGACIRPFLLASIATKLMWFIMLLLVMILSCFFIIPYGSPDGNTNLAETSICRDGNGMYFRVKNTIPSVVSLSNPPVENGTGIGTGNCFMHAGYFFVYRFFLSFEVLLLISCLIMINVKSTGKNKKRAKMHHGFWMYKYIILLVLIIIFCTALKVVGGGIFELIMSAFGLFAVALFSFVEITFILDLVELLCEKYHRIKSDWKGFCYWSFCGFVLLLDMTLLSLVCSYYGTYHVDGDGRDEDHKYQKGGIEWIHATIIAIAIILILLLLLAGIFSMVRKRFKYHDGLLQTSFVILYVIVSIWIALGSSPKKDARPEVNLGLKDYKERRTGNWDTDFKYEGLIHGLTSLFALVYYCFWHGPRSNTAPLSILFDKMFYCKAKKSEVPVIPCLDGNCEDLILYGVAVESQAPDRTEGPADAERTGSSSSAKEMQFSTTKDKAVQKNIILAEDFQHAWQERRLLDDEIEGVRYSWSLFYVFMIFGSLSIMMGMTNLFNPWGTQREATSIPALVVKILIAACVTFLYLFITLIHCPRIFPEAYNLPSSENANKDPEPSSSKREEKDVEEGEMEPTTPVDSKGSKTNSVLPEPGAETEPEPPTETKSSSPSTKEKQEEDNEELPFCTTPTLMLYQLHPVST